MCDGALPHFREATLAVVGGGDSAMEDALYLTKFAKEVILVHRRDEFRASKIMAGRVLSNEKIRVEWNKVATEVVGDDVITGLKLKDTVTGEESELEVGGLFVAIGHEPNTGFLAGQVELKDNGYVATPVPWRTETSVPGVFAAGDVFDDYFRQAITAAGNGLHGCAGGRALAGAWGWGRLEGGPESEGEKRNPYGRSVPNARLYLLEPVLHEYQRRSGRRLHLKHDEAIAIRVHRISPRSRAPQELIDWEEGSPLLDGERRLGGHRGRDLVCRPAVEQLSTVRRPQGLVASVRRNLIAGRVGVWEWPHVDLHSSRLVGGVGEPPSVRGDGCSPIGEVATYQHCRRRIRARAEGEEVCVAEVAGAEDEPLASGGHGRLHQGHGPVEHELRSSASVGRPGPEVPLAGPVRKEEGRSLRPPTSSAAS